MSRTVLGVDRLVTAVLGLVLLAAGVAAVVWQVWAPSGFPRSVDLSAIAGAPEQPWWSWTLLAGGAALAALGLWWLLAHLPGQGVDRVSLPGSATGARLEASTGPIAAAAAAELAQVPGVRGARGRILRDRGRLVGQLTATIDPDADLARLARDASEVGGQLHQVLGRPDHQVRIQLRVARRARSRSTVR